MILFATSGGSGLGRTAKDLAPSCPGAVIGRDKSCAEALRKRN